MKIGIVGAGQFAGSFASLWQLHPDVTSVQITDLIPERAEAMASRYGLAGTLPDADAVVDSDVDAVAVFTQRWLHAPLVLQALAAGKHVYSAVPMAYTADEVAAVVAEVERTGLVYMLGETSYYNPAVVHARRQLADGAFGRLFYAEGDYVHDMDNGFYAAYQFSGGEDWKPTASYPPMQYPTHAVGGVLGAWPTHATGVSCIGIPDDRGDGVFDREVSLFGNDWSNMSAHFQLADGGVMRINEFRRVGHPSHVHESRFRFYGTDGVLEQHSAAATWSDRQELVDISPLFRTGTEHVPAAEREGIDPALLHSFMSGTAPVQDRAGLPAEFEGAKNGHEGSHHFLADDFVRAVTRRTQPPVNAWLAARFNLPGIAAMESARRGGERVDVPDHGDGPEIDWSAFRL
ncbi:Gfo/Idh/MocA family protein [Auraticoccus monumenti]|uniref:Predicted dehydrogenase n=1 Tax=Auraticoccus monumenti TaxID=675864 RepID=A0A1G7EVP4_9ACTN|nr:Gfo/Idh/MocA family oxidoreductase [Auraticoccus monumenti]SDE67750.1 Predicted dehydrogenase [Auraticoccus monumenti]